jgi:hypothetical protein
VGGGDQGEKDLVDDLGEELVRGVAARTHHLVAQQISRQRGNPAGDLVAAGLAAVGGASSARPIVIAGLLLTAAGTLAFAWAGPRTSEWLLAASLFVRGAGLAPVTIAVVAGAFRDIPSEDVPDASSTTRIVQQVGGSFGSAVLALILASALLSHRAVTPAVRGLAFDTAFWWAIGLTALALVPAVLLQASRNGRADEPVGGRIRNAVEEAAEDVTEHRLLRGRAKKQRG